jgi:predicted nucleotidyltransferase
MLKVLFSSETRVKILSLLITNPHNRYYLREIIKLINAPAQAVQRELSKLEKISLIEKQTEGNRRYYRINSSHIIFPDLKNIILKTVGFGEMLRTPLLRQKEIEVAFIYGSYAENSETAKSDIDIFIIGFISGKKLQSLLRKLSQSYGRKINPVIYSAAEFKKKRSDHFISTVLKSPKIMLKGDPDAL